MRYAAVYAPSNMIIEVREGDAPPAYVPPDCEWVDVSDQPQTDIELLGSQWIDGALVPRVVPPNFNLDLDMGGTSAEIIGS